jgi:hypothetical protein
MVSNQTDEKRMWLAKNGIIKQANQQRRQAKNIMTCNQAMKSGRHHRRRREAAKAISVKRRRQKQQSKPLDGSDAPVYNGM